MKRMRNRRWWNKNCMNIIRITIYIFTMTSTLNMTMTMITMAMTATMTMTECCCICLFYYSYSHSSSLNNYFPAARTLVFTAPLRLSENAEEVGNHAEINPFPSLSKTLKASLISSQLKTLQVNGAIAICINLIDHVLHCSVGFCPRERMTVPSSKMMANLSPTLTFMLNIW